MPVLIIAGEEDRIADIDDQSARLRQDGAQSKLIRIPHTGHMVHQTATRRLLREIDEMSEATGNVVPLAA
jgi:pimeloyl-ACP methyl ester carboxylesterase